MFNKAKQYLLKSYDYLPTVQKFINGSPSMKAVYITCFVLIFIIATFFGMYFWNFKNRGVVDLNILIDLFRATTATQVLAFIVFLVKALVDKDDNGISDSIENEIRKEGDSNN
ncbi:hypothetical protein LJC10_00420 [Selenomonadales bacterium OttesenSCG-928-I06]|nr:hypothetical protein [Selenomonadales bacterium OttesenSCG-928-I06]